MSNKINNNDVNNMNRNSKNNSNTSYASNINTVKPKVNLDNLANYTNDSFESLAFSKMDKSHLDSKKDSRISNINPKSYENSKNDKNLTPNPNLNKFNN